MTFNLCSLLISSGVTIDNCTAIAIARKKVQLATGQTPWKNPEQSNQFHWPVWFPYPSSWLRTLSLVLWIGIVVRIVSFWSAIGGFILSAVAEEPGPLLQALGLALVVSVIILSYIHHILFGKPLPDYPRWLPTPRSLWEGMYAPIVFMFSSIMVIIIILPFFPIVPNCNYATILNQSCLESYQQEIKTYFFILKYAAPAIWLITAAYLYQIDRLLRQNFSVKNLAKFILTVLLLFGFVGQIVFAKSFFEFEQARPFVASQTPSPVPSASTNLSPQAVKSQEALLPNTPDSQEAALSTESDPFQDAVNQAMNAANLAQTAESEADWNTVTTEWEQARDLMKAVPSSHPKYQVAQAKIREYQKNIAAINKKGDRSFQQGINEAETAAFFAKTAKSKGEWEVVVSQWEKAIDLMKAVQPSSPNYAVARNRIVQYQGNLKAAKLAANRAK